MHGMHASLVCTDVLQIWTLGAAEAEVFTLLEHIPDRRVAPPMLLFTHNARTCIRRRR